MSRRRTRAFLPRRLTALAPRRLKWVRALWFLALAFAVVLDIAGTVFLVRDHYRSDPQFHRLALASQVEDDGSVTVSSIDRLAGIPAVAALSRVTAINGRPVARETRVWDLAARLKADDGQIVTLAIRAPEGRLSTYRVEASDRYLRQAAYPGPVDRGTRMAIQLVASLLSCATLIGCALMLFLRRPRDPVALLFSFAFLIFAAVIIPPLNLWLAAGVGDAFDVYSTLGWCLLVIGIAAFPDGKFTQPPVRWVLVVAPLLMVPLAIDEVPMLVGTGIAFVLPLFLLICHVIKYRRFEPGIERQQVKWAAFGFGSGLLLLTAAFVVLAATDTAVGPQPLFGLIVIGLFNLGFIAMALGLLVSLVRFRLWEADAVIGRSAVSAAVTLMVGIVWTLSMDMVKVVVEWVLGEENETVATAVGAVIAAGIFAPTQALAMRWARRRLEGDESRVRKLAGRLAAWRATRASRCACRSRTRTARSDCCWSARARILTATTPPSSAAWPTSPSRSPRPCAPRSSAPTMPRACTSSSARSRNGLPGSSSRGRGSARARRRWPRAPLPRAGPARSAAAGPCWSLSRQAGRSRRRYRQRARRTG